MSSRFLIDYKRLLSVVRCGLRSLSRRHAAVLLAAVAALAASPAGAEKREGSAATKKAPRAPIAARAVNGEPVRDGAPDPLTPAAVERGSPLAPESVPFEPQTTGTPAAAVDPIVVAVRELLAGRRAAVDAHRDDRAGIERYYAAQATQPLWIGPGGFTAKARAVAAEIQQADDWGLDRSAFRLPAPPAADSGPAALAETEAALSLAVLAYARHARGGRTSPASISRMIDMKPRVFEPDSVLRGIAAVKDAEAYLASLHPRHPGFHALRKALLASRADSPPAAPLPEPAASTERSVGKKRSAPAASQAEIRQRIVVNMERWRWMPDELGAIHVHDNVPEQMTRVIKGDRVLLAEKIVVGKPSTPTPTFSADMQFIIFHPSWGVPDGIKSNELAPMLRRASNDGGWLFGGGQGASAALRRHNLRVYAGGREIDPDSINWSSVDIRRFQFSQPPSSTNVLGVVKFRFPNRFDVYMHDTPERQLFNGSLRTFSHGCMRVQNPMRLAEVLLAHDKGWSAEKVNSFVGRGGTTDVTLDTPIPVHVTYFTATADEAGQLQLHPDFYGLDSRVATALAGRPVHLVSTAAPDEADVRSADRRKAGPKKGGSSEPAFDPWSRLSSN